MTRLWLAAVLGIIVGLGLALAPMAPSTSVMKGALPDTLREEQTQLAATTAPSPPAIQFVVLALLIGVIVAAPFFFVAKRRSG